MKKITMILALVFLSSNGWTDIAPNPIILKSIMTYKPCEIQMVSETVYIDLYADSSFVSCTFNMTNHGDSITLPIGFPVMNFLHWNIGEYGNADKEKFQIFVDNKMLDKDDIQVPDEMKSIYSKYMEVIWADKERERKQDSVDALYGVIKRRNSTMITSGSYEAYRKASDKLYEWRQTKPYFGSVLYGEFDSLMKKGNYPWYIWKVKFEKGGSSIIKVNYRVPSGIGYGGEYRYLKYLISTGTGWKDKITKADINVRLHDVQVKTVETINPTNYRLDKSSKTIRWSFIDIEPTTDSDIYVKYYNPREKRKWEKLKDKRTRQLNK